MDKPLRKRPAATSPRDLLTPAGLHILLALAGGELHGYGIKKDIDRRTDGALRIGPATLYEAIHRMLTAGWIETVSESAKAAASGRRKSYRLTAEGRRQLEKEIARLDEIVGYARAKNLLPASRSS